MELCLEREREEGKREEEREGRKEIELKEKGDYIMYMYFRLHYIILNNFQNLYFVIIKNTAAIYA